MHCAHIQAIPPSLYRHFWVGRLIFGRPTLVCREEKADAQTQEETHIHVSASIDKSAALGYTLIVILR
jgi:hypothetical protein